MRSTTDLLLNRFPLLFSLVLPAVDFVYSSDCVVVSEWKNFDWRDVEQGEDMPKG